MLLTGISCWFWLVALVACDRCFLVAYALVIFVDHSLGYFYGFWLAILVASDWWFVESHSFNFLLLAVCICRCVAKSRVRSMLLREAVVPIINRTTCQQWFDTTWEKPYVSQESLCAGFKTGGVDSCTVSPLLVHV